MPTGRINNFLQKGHGPGHVAPKFLAYDRTDVQNCLSYKDFKFGT